MVEHNENIRKAILEKEQLTLNLMTISIEDAQDFGEIHMELNASNIVSLLLL